MLFIDLIISVNEVNFLLKIAIYMQIIFAEEASLMERFTFPRCYTSELEKSLIKCSMYMKTNSIKNG
jgi:hypothetical protein